MKIIDFHIWSNSRNAILLLERRILVGVGYRTKIINLKRDSVFKFSIDLSVGLMQEVEELNRDKLPINEKYYTIIPDQLFLLWAYWN